jgi:hypothetical protein
MEYFIKQICKGRYGVFNVDRGKREFENYPSKFDEVLIVIDHNQVKTEIVHIQNKVIFVERITM